MQSSAHFHCSIFHLPMLYLPLPLFLHLSAAFSSSSSFLHLYRAGCNNMIPLLPSFPDVTLLQHKHPQPPTTSTLLCPARSRSQDSINIQYSIDLSDLSLCFILNHIICCLLLCSEGWRCYLVACDSDAAPHPVFHVLLRGGDGCATRLAEIVSAELHCHYREMASQSWLRFM